MELKYKLRQEVYYADLAQIKIHKGFIVGYQVALPREGEDPIVSYQLNNGIVFAEEDIHASFEEAKIQIVGIAKQFEGLKENEK